MQQALVSCRACKTGCARIVQRKRLYSSRPGSPSLHDKAWRVAVIGSGPAGFYAASRLLGLEGSRSLKIDMFEELPVPFGLVRYGVAPDHPEVKNCSHKFEETAADSRFRYFGNVQVGGPADDIPKSASSSRVSSPFKAPQDPARSTRHALNVPLSFLRKYYHAILFTYGASKDRSLGPSVMNDDAPDLMNVHSARSFVHWYNGHPHSPFHQDPASNKLDLSNLHKASIIGQGNVALDCARILLSGAQQPGVERLAKTDVPEPVLAALAASEISEVDVVGRRGPLQFAGTTKEVRELVTLDEANVEFRLSQQDRQLVDGSLAELDAFSAAGGKMENERMKKRILGLMRKAKTADPNANLSKNKAWSLSFCRSPIALLGKVGTSTGPIASIKYELNDLVPVSSSTIPSNELVDPSGFVARGNGKTVVDSADLVLKSVGYRSIGIQGLPFDERKGVVRNVNGRVQDAQGNELDGLYVSGWLARGPNGVIATTMYDAFDTAELIAADLGVSDGEDKPELPDLTQAGFGDEKVVSWAEWKAIDRQERVNGEKLGKEREKFLTVKDMLQVLG